MVGSVGTWGVVASGLVAALVVTGLPPQRGWAEDPPVDDPAPEVSVPVLAKPDTAPVPELKNPEDGVVVELPNPGAAGISRISMVPPCRAPTTAASIDVVALPMTTVTVGAVRVDGEMSTGPT